jgi:ammonia channel protein AmtB
MNSAHTIGVLARLLLAGGLAAAVMFAMVSGLIRWEGGSIDTVNRLELLANVIASSIVGTAVYLVAAWAMRVHEVKDVLSLVGRMAGRARRAGRQ